MINTAQPARLHELDSSRWLTIVGCHACPGWRASGNTKAQAWTQAAAHATGVHGDRAEYKRAHSKARDAVRAANRKSSTPARGV